MSLLLAQQRLTSPPGLRPQTHLGEQHMEQQQREPVTAGHCRRSASTFPASAELLSQERRINHQGSTGHAAPCPPGQLWPQGPSCDAAELPAHPSHRAPTMIQLPGHHKTQTHSPGAWHHFGKSVTPLPSVSHAVWAKADTSLLTPQLGSAAPRACQWPGGDEAEPRAHRGPVLREHLWHWTGPGSL